MYWAAAIGPVAVCPIAIVHTLAWVRLTEGTRSGLVVGETLVVAIASVMLVRGGHNGYGWRAE